MTYAAPWYCPEFIVAYCFSHFVHVSWEDTKNVGERIKNLLCRGWPYIISCIRFCITLVLYFFVSLSFSNGKIEVNLIVWAPPAFDVSIVSIWSKLQYYFRELAYIKMNLMRNWRIHYLDQ